MSAPALLAMEAAGAGCSVGIEGILSLTGPLTATDSWASTAVHLRIRHWPASALNATVDECIPFSRLNAYLWPVRSSVTWGKGGPHSGYRHLADKDEVPGSSPGRPTTGPDQRKCWPGCLEFAWRGVCRITNSYLVTVARYEPCAHEPPVVHAIEPVDASLPRLRWCTYRSVLVARPRFVVLLWGMLSSLLRHALQDAAANTKSSIS
jgi:hypothetical protein